MATTRVFKSGNSQAVRVPKEFSVSSKVLEIFRRCQGCGGHVPDNPALV